MSTHPKSHHYRPDIDGLRSIAILPVVLFHAGVAGFSGGFVGVDVFFVISGYLITSLLLRDIDKEAFSILSFYDRRIRRIFPALFFVILLTFGFAWFLYFPDEMHDLSESTLATTFFVSNIYFWQEADYFARAADYRLLLHTWSLAVEEQFYIVFPIFIAITCRFGRRIALISTLAILILSFVVAVLLTYDKPVAAFYLPVTRAWELLIGSALAFHPFTAPSNRKANSLLALLGLGLILVPVATYSEATHFPGLAALPPCLGAAILIFSGTGADNPISQTLKQRPLVFIGLISYSLYLVHWPVLVFFKYSWMKSNFTKMETIVLLSIMFVLAYLSWRFIERPFRNPNSFNRKQVFQFGSFAMLIATLVGTAGVIEGGFPKRFNTDTLEILKAEHDKDSAARQCLAAGADTAFTDPDCQMGTPSAAAPTFALWGDSHAASFFPALNSVAKDKSLSGVFFGKSSCPPLAGVDRIDPGSPNSCSAWSKSVLQALTSTKSIQTVFINARWAQYAEGTRYGDELGTPVFIGDQLTRGSSASQNKLTLERSLHSTMSVLSESGINIVLVGPTPEVGINVPRSLATKELRGSRISIEPQRSSFATRQAFSLELLYKLAQEFDAELILPHEVLCGPDTCNVTSANGPLYFDDDHLSTVGAAILAPLVSTTLKTN